MKKNITIVVLSVLVILSCLGWFISAREARSNAVVMHSEAKIITKQILSKEKNINLKNGDSIKTQDFKIEYYDQGNGYYSVIVVPNDKSQKIVGQQGENAEGIELINIK